MATTKAVLTEWRFRGEGETGWLPAKVPGCVHTDLLRNGRIPDPFYGTNERRLQWIDKQDWEYETTFDVPPDVRGMAHKELVFAGLDTYADVYLNGELVLRADNMFCTWRLDVTHLLQETGNHLRVYFHSPVKVDLPKLNRLGYGLPAVNDQSELGGLGDKRISVFARKAPYHYGWDWGPRFVTSGIWRDVWLEGWADCRITDLFIEQRDVTAERAQLTAWVEVEADRAIAADVTVSTDGACAAVKAQLAPGVNRVRVDIVMDQPRLWWCNGLGEPYLYTFHAKVATDGRVLAERSVRTGLRRLRLVQEPDEHGTSFYFELNGVPVFARGANHIPNDSFITEVTYERYRHEVASAAAANMNMLRVWGGGIYEQDDFYDLCDEYGILVWQDFMFACSMYPGDEHFLASVAAEAEDNIRRLRNHPCIALWCGNNEIDVAWAEYDERLGWGWKQQYPPEVRKKIWQDYEAIFHRILPEAVQRLAPGAPYWPSSPMAAWTNDARQHATNRTTSGDIHYWGVWHAVEPFENYNINIGRFMSEYGFQSFPEYKSVRAYAEESDLRLDSEVMLAHQKNGRGNFLIKEYMDIYMKEPKDFPSFLYVSQVLQAEAMKTAIEAHRRKKPFTMGSLYWQINDCWPVASWSSIDYFGRWKATQYYAKRCYRPVAVNIDGTGAETVDVYVVSDVLTPMTGHLRWRLLDFAGQVLQEGAEAVAVAPGAVVKAVSLRKSHLLALGPADRIVLVATLEQGDAVVDEKEHYFVPAKDLALSVPNISVREIRDGDGVRFVLATDVLAKQVWLAAEVDGVFSDNFFDLVPGREKEVVFLTLQPGARTFMPAQPGHVTVRSMADFVRL
ncbi:beta-mannosidase [Alicyclobacillus cellulosilyticus]|uniref:Beta-mannosidase B n=1 Tax=Alicyclobacillus cellulosilyticus TaxID=1003997 RepID=A0A917NGQ0_9BACL|nr:glycoside hydrolase family 2 protein [Alicyclobacillus cellulosilyticus]GGI99038.1 beta-mannosidase [Alicyclobacillus cellulosilyticus]